MPKTTSKQKSTPHRPAHRPALYGQAMTTFKFRLPQTWLDRIQQAEASDAEQRGTEPRGAAQRIRDHLRQLPEVQAILKG